MLVQIIALGIVALLFVFACFDVKKTVILWLSFKLLFNNQIAIRYNSPGISLVIAGDVLLFAMLLFYDLRQASNRKIERSSKHNPSSNKLYSGRFIFMYPAIAYAISYGLSLIITIAPVSTAFIATIKFFITSFCTLFMAHKVFRDLNDIMLFAKTSVVIMLLIVILALSENILNTNLWLDFVYYNSPYDPDAGRMYYTPGEMEYRYGFVRSRSFFGYHIPFGFACVAMAWFFLYLYRSKLRLKGILSQNFLLIVAVLTILGVFMSNSKQAYIGLLVIFFSIYPFRSLINPKIILPLLFVFVGVMLWVPDYMNNLLSLFDSDLADEGGGSTVALRRSQFTVALEMFTMNPIFGNGVASLDSLKSIGDFDSILGAESAWLSILPERGILGAVVYLYLFIYLYFKSIKVINKRVILFFLLSIFIIESVGGVKDMSVWGVVYLAIYRFNQIRKCSIRQLYRQSRTINNKELSHV